VTDIRAALRFPATFISGEAAAFDEGVFLLSKPEICPSQRGQRHGGGNHLLQGRAPVLKSSEHARPVIEPTVVHGLSLRSSF
jgi:hypothetical protein